MKEKFISILKWRFDLPSLIEYRAMNRLFSQRERGLFIFALILLFLGMIGTLWVLSDNLSVTVPTEGGKWKEGVVGSPHLANPLLAISDADRDLIILIYSGLMRPDGRGRLTPDLTKSLEISEDGLLYTFTLKEGLLWHDGKPITSHDIEFTIQTAKNPALKSPVRASWEGVNVEVVDERTLRFLLDQPYAPFLGNTTLGILPKHIWENVLIEQFSLSNFNLNPIGSGPYMVSEFERNASGVITKYNLQSFKDYAGGKPLIKTVELKFYPTEKALRDAFINGGVDAISTVSPNALGELSEKDAQIRTLTLPRVFGVFFNQNQANTFTESEVREAMNLAVDRNKIINEVLAGYAKPTISPIPPGTFGSIEDIEEITATTSKDLASTTLKEAGWKLNEEENIRIKKTKTGTRELKFSMATSNTSDLVRTAELLKNMWGELGIQIDLKIFEISDLNQQVIRPREYDILLFGEIVGRDPDPFAFWHSSQINDPGLNIALYTNTTVDKLLEEARTEFDEEKRKEKYIEFQKEVIEETPAIFLYSPLFLYVTGDKLEGFETENITIPSERFARIHKWYLRTNKVLKYFVE